MTRRILILDETPSSQAVGRTERVYIPLANGTDLDWSLVSSPRTSREAMREGLHVVLLMLGCVLCWCAGWFCVFNGRPGTGMFCAAIGAFMAARAWFLVWTWGSPLAWIMYPVERDGLLMPPPSGLMWDHPRGTNPPAPKHLRPAAPGPAIPSPSSVAMLHDLPGLIPEARRASENGGVA